MSFDAWMRDDDELRRQRMQAQMLSQSALTPEQKAALAYDPAQDQQALARQQQFANMLRSSKTPGVKQVGNIAAVNLWEGAASAFDKALGGYLAGKANKESERIGGLTQAKNEAVQAQEEYKLAEARALEENRRQADMNFQRELLDIKTGRDEEAAATAAAAKATEAAQKGESDLRKEFTKLPEVQAFKEVDTAYGRVLAGDPNESAATQMSLIFNYMKMLDPGSTVREGEFATARQTTGIPGNIVNLYNQAKSGKFLNPTQVAEFQKQAGQLYLNQKKSFDQAVDGYTALANEYEYKPENVIKVTPNYTGLEMEEVKPPEVPLATAGNPAPPEGGIPKGFETVWQYMDEKERQDVLRAAGRL